MTAYRERDDVSAPGYFPKTIDGIVVRPEESECKGLYTEERSVSLDPDPNAPPADAGMG